MSNVIKYWGAKENASDRIINSNPKVDAFFSELLRRKEEERRNGTQQNGETGSGDFKEIDFSSLPKAIDVSRLENDAGKKAEEILAKANEKSEILLHQAMEQAKRQEKELMDIAREKGYKEGLELAEKELREKERLLEEEKKRYELQYEEEARSLVPKFTDLVIKYVEKLTGIMAEEYESVIYNVMASAISHSEPCKSYVIYVPKEQYKYVLSKEDYIREVVGDHATFEIMADSTLSVNDCKIETENFVIDSGLDTRLMNLINSLKILSDSYE